MACLQKNVSPQGNHDEQGFRQRYKPRLISLLVASLFGSVAFLSPGDAAGGETIIYEKAGDYDLRTPIDSFPAAVDSDGNKNNLSSDFNKAGSLFSDSSASDNRVYLRNGTIGGNVYGGIAPGGPLPPSASSNFVVITGGRVNGAVYGGLASGSAAFSNRVSITNARVDGITYGAKITSGSGMHGYDNTVTIDSGATIRGNVYGAYNSGSGDVYENHVFIKGGDISTSTVSIISGGYIFVPGGQVRGNTVTIDGGTINIPGTSENITISGGRGQSSGTSAAHITGNKVFINGGNITVGSQGGIYGGQHIQGSNTSARLNLNEVVITGGNINAHVYGARASGNSTVDAVENLVRLDGGNITGNIYGGSVQTSTARANEVSLSGATVTGDIFAGHTSSNGTVTGNVVNLYGGTVTGTVHGTNLDGAWRNANNRLYVKGGLTNVGGIRHFQNVDISSGASINVTGNVAESAIFEDLTNSGRLTFFNNSATPKVAHFLGSYTGTGIIGLDVRFGQPDIGIADTLLFDANVLEPDQKVKLAISALSGSTLPDNIDTINIKIAEVASAPGDTDYFTTTEHGYGVYAYEIRQDGDEYFLGLRADNPGEKGKVYTKASAAGLAQLALLDTFMRNSLDTAMSEAARRGFGISISPAYTSQRIRTGSHVDLDGTSLIATVAFNKKQSPLSVGMFAELFSGRYQTSDAIYSTGNGFAHKSARGDLESYGAGFSIQYRERLAEALAENIPSTWVQGLHMEATVRAGYSRMNLQTNKDNPSTFSTGSMYHGASVSAGYVFEPAANFMTDIYGRALWTSVAKREVRDSLGMTIQFERANSMRLISGFRTAFIAKDADIRPYFGMALDWETMGKPKVYVDSFKADRADISGLSGLIELGFNSRLDKGLFFDMKIAGSVGQRTGIGGMLELKYEF